MVKTQTNASHVEVCNIVRNHANSEMLHVIKGHTRPVCKALPSGRGGRYSHTLPILVCAAQREAPVLERGIYFRDVF